MQCSQAGVGATRATCNESCFGGARPARRASIETRATGVDRCRQRTRGVSEGSECFRAEPPSRGQTAWRIGGMVRRELQTVALPAFGTEDHSATWRDGARRESRARSGGRRSGPLGTLGHGEAQTRADFDIMRMRSRGMTAASDGWAGPDGVTVDRIVVFVPQVLGSKGQSILSRVLVGDRIVGSRRSAASGKRDMALRPASARFHPVR